MKYFAIPGYIRTKTSSLEILAVNIANGQSDIFNNYRATEIFGTADAVIKWKILMVRWIFKMKNFYTIFKGIREKQ